MHWEHKGHRFIGKAHSNIPAFHGHPNIPRGTKDFSLSEPTSICQLGFLFESAGADAYKDMERLTMFEDLARMSSICNYCSTNFVFHDFQIHHKEELRWAARKLSGQGDENHLNIQFNTAPRLSCAKP